MRHYPIPPQVDSVAAGGTNAGQVTLGIYEIVDATHTGRQRTNPPVLGKDRPGPTGAVA